MSGPFIFQRYEHNFQISDCFQGTICQYPKLPAAWHWSHITHITVAVGGDRNCVGKNSINSVTFSFLWPFQPAICTISNEWEKVIHYNPITQQGLYSIFTECRHSVPSRKHSCKGAPLFFIRVNNLSLTMFTVHIKFH